MMDGENEIASLSFLFAVRIVKLYKYLCEDKKEFVLSKQLLRCGTSVGANVTEAQSAQSKKDFIAKMSIAQKEARESEYWIRLLLETGHPPKDNPKVESLQNELESIICLQSAILISSKNSPK